MLTDFVTDAYITDVIVNPDFQGKGLGKQLVNKALGRVKEHSVEEVKLACVYMQILVKNHFMLNLVFRNFQMINTGMVC